MEGLNFTRRLVKMMLFACLIQTNEEDKGVLNKSFASKNKYEVKRERNIKGRGNEFCFCSEDETLKHMKLLTPGLSLVS